MTQKHQIVAEYDGSIDVIIWDPTFGLIGYDHPRRAFRPVTMDQLNLAIGEAETLHRNLLRIRDEAKNK